MDRIYQTIVGRPLPVLLVIAAITAFFGFEASHIRVDSSVEALLPENDPEKAYYDQIRRLYGSDEIGVVAVVAPDVYQPDVLRKIERLTDEIGRIDGVQKVISLTNVLDPVEDAIEPPKLVPRIPRTTDEARKLREKLADRAIYQKNLVSPDGRAAAINVFFADIPDDEFMRRGIDEQVESVAESARGPEEIYYTGLPHFKVYSAKAMRRDLAHFVPLTLLIIVAVLFASFRSLRGVALPALTVVVSLVWTLGIMVLAGSNLSLGTTSLPPLVLVIGTAYSLHVIAEYYELAAAGGSPRATVVETLRHVTAPASIAAVTTVLGFLSIAVNDISSIREMGIYSSIGIAIAFLLSLLLVPPCLALLPAPPAPATRDFAPGLSA
ncbi:MAG: uncharacterized protein QOD06_373, partial [Candidatus Binatota bacterium]|nr:uncharacterized protein [Candidatus Binatota bacterium]